MGFRGVSELFTGFQRQSRGLRDVSGGFRGVQVISVDLQVSQECSRWFPGHSGGSQGVSSSFQEIYRVFRDFQWVAIVFQELSGALQGCFCCFYEHSIGRQGVSGLVLGILKCSGMKHLILLKVWEVQKGQGRSKGIKALSEEYQKRFGGVSWKF